VPQLEKELALGKGAKEIVELKIQLFERNTST